MAQNAEITGKVEYREGDGPLLRIRKGPVEVTNTALDATLSWQDEGGDVRSSTAMPIADFKRYLAEGAIRLTD
ncbi:hypothetical protein [Pseudorhodoferax sp.]|uniref:hypothetical protein n=1 Tax=Pseudorhodoferax sp. TaxID=1993553 RepID=UPI002DD6A1F7|nr:hypothetical protein [Pseudorhodoferax sp.]